MIGLKWHRDAPPILALFQDAVMYPLQNVHVWYALGAILLTIMAAGYAGWSCEWLWSRANLEVTLSEADLASGRILVLCAWCVVRSGACLRAFATRWLGTHSASPTKHRVRSCLACVVSPAMESLSFWFDVLWLHSTWLNKDVRYRAFATYATVVYTAGCVAYALISLCLVFPLSARLDAKQIKLHPALWAAIIVLSWCASPSLLTLLPWTSHAFGNLPTMCAMDAVYVTKSLFKGALVSVKIALIVILKADDQLIKITLLLNVIIFVRGQLKRALSLAAMRALRSRWTRVPIFLSYRVDSDQELARALHKQLTAVGLRVWFDEKCLAPGESWEDGFARGLLGSKVFVPVLSRDGLARFARLREDSDVDNVLLEHLLALEQHQRQRLHAIFPIFVGSLNAQGMHGHLLKEGGMPTCADADVPVRAVEARARDHLARQHGASDGGLLVGDRSPRGVLTQLKKYQGEFIVGERDVALERIGRKVCAMAKEVANRDSGGGLPPVDEHGLGHWVDLLGQWLVWLWCVLPTTCSRTSRGSASRRWRRWLSRADGTPSLLRADDVSKYFASGEMHSEAVDKFNPEADNALIVNPILVQKAKWRQEKEQRAKQNASGASPALRSGGLARLNLMVEQPLSPVARALREVHRYVERYEGVRRASVGADQRKRVGECNVSEHSASSLKLDEDVQQRVQQRDHLLQQRGTRASRLSSVRHSFAVPRLKVVPTQLLGRSMEEATGDVLVEPRTADGPEAKAHDKARGRRVSHV